MTTCARLVGAALLLGIAASIAPAAERPKGTLDVLRGPNPGDQVEGEARGPQVRPKGSGKLPGPPRPAGVPDAPSLDQRIARLQKKIDRMRKVPPAGIAPVRNLDEATGAVKMLRETRDRARKDLDAADRQEAGRVRAAVAAFDAKWSEAPGAHHKGLTAKDVLKGDMPAGMDPAKWARLSDAVAAEAADLEAYAAQARQKLFTGRRQQLTELEQTVERAEQWLNRRQEHDAKAGGDRRESVQQEMGRRVHLAAIAAAERVLDRLKKLKAEREGKPSGREDPVAKEMRKGTGLWMVDALRGRVLREMILSNCTYPPKGRPDDPDATLGAPPSWMGKYGAIDVQRAKCQWIAEQLRLARSNLGHAEKELVDGDQAELRKWREALDDVDREDGLLGHPKRVARRETLMKGFTAELTRTRQKRLDALRGEYTKDIDAYSGSLAEESKVLRKMEQAAGNRKGPVGAKKGAGD